MLKPKKKITKKELKEDKFVKYTLQAKTYLDENSKQVFYMVAGILGVALICKRGGSTGTVRYCTG